MTTEYSDFLARFMTYTEGAPTPEIFRLWTGIATIAGALERRTWVVTTRKVLFPNLFVMLAGPPGAGKSAAIDFARDLWHSTKDQGRPKFHLAPQNMSRAGLFDALAEAARRIVVPDNIIEYHTLLIAIGEVGVLLSQHDLDFLATLNHVYDNPPVLDEKLRHVHGGKTKEIISPQLTILAGAQPTFMNNILPEEAWSMGFTSRCLMIYGGEAPPPDLFSDIDPREAQRRSLLASVMDFSKLMGQFVWEDEAMVELQRWAKTKCEPTPDHPKLIHYVSRRLLHTIKLSMVATVSRSCALRITLADVNRARDWLLHAETRMPELFRAMLGKSDAHAIQELYTFAWTAWSKDRKAIHETRLIHFLHDRVGVDKVYRVLEIAVRSGMFLCEPNFKLYTPVARHMQETQ